MWIPNIVLGAAGDRAARLALEARRPEPPPAIADAALAGVATFTSAIERAADTHRRGDTAADAGRAATRRRARRSHSAVRASRAPTCSISTSPAPTSACCDVHRRHHGPVLHLDVHRQVRQAVQGADHARRCCCSFSGGRRRSSSTTSSRSRCCSPAIVTIGAADEEQRAHRDARVRHQPLSHGGAAAGVRRDCQRRALRVRGARAGLLEPARRTICNHIIRGGSPQTFDVAEPQVGGRT